ncbi:class A sortase [Lacticaseibacillus baoqingensis]|uniref:Class A sortase n=1 Tax=Lacticaseibacillus baoqingensis TaxID=2486013 RepID=A0ABW4EAV9_9LACO|nr:class A sortase [Lacticaseibacillus baoqingensis]
MIKPLKQLLLTVLLVAAAAFLSVYLWQDQLSALLVQHNHVTVSQKVVRANQHHAKTADYRFDQVQPLSLARLSQAAVAKHQVAAVGKLVIPAVQLNLPIVLGVGNAELAFAAGTLNAHQKMGQSNYALAGHHMAQDERVLFGPLVKTTLGMVAYVTDMTHVYAYQIDARRYLPATAVSVLNPTADPELTLITCDDDGTGRLMIQARLVQTFTVDRAPQALQKLIAAT